MVHKKTNRTNGERPTISSHIPERPLRHPRRGDAVRPSRSLVQGPRARKRGASHDVGIDMDALRESGIEVVGAVPWGTHFCQFYQTSQDLVATLVPYFREGLAAREFCMWVTSPPLQVHEAKGALRMAVPDLDEYIARGQIEILDYRDWYTKSGEFHADEVLQAWVDKHDDALRRGYEGLRLTGNTFWLEPTFWEDFAQYEEKINDIIGQYSMLAICTYCLEKCGALEIAEVVANHQFALIKRSGRWQMVESSRHRLTETALRASEATYRAIFNATNDGILVLDIETGEIVDANATFRNVFGYAPEEARGLRVGDFSSGEPAYTQEDALRLIRKAAGGEPQHFEWLAKSRDGRLLWIDVTLKRATIAGRDCVLAVGRDITERKRSETALRASQERYRLLAENVTDVIWTADLDLNLTYISPSDQRLSGYAPQERIGVTAKEALTPSSLEAVQAALAEELAIECREQKDLTRSRTMEVEVYRKDGSTVWAEMKMTFLRDPDGRPLGILGVTRDITDRKQAEEALRETSQTLQALIQVSPLAITTTDLQGNIRTWNPAAERTFGWSEQEALGRPNPIIPEDRQDEFRANLDAVLQGNLLNQVETRRRKKDGSLIDVSLSTAAMRNAAGDVIGAMGIIADITERKQAEEPLRESENRFRTLSEESFEGIAIHRKGTILDANQPLAAMFGYELSEVIGMHVLDFVAPESRDTVLQSIVSKSREPFEFTGLRKDGSTFPVEVCGRPIPYQGKMVTVAALRDLTERKQKEEAVQKVREELENRVERQMERGNPYGLTFRELTVLHVVAAGKADKEIAGQLGISTLTASKHVANILDKMGAASRTEACVRALREGLLD